MGAPGASATTTVQAVAVPASASFGSVVVGTTNTQAVEVQNHGKVAFTITKVTVVGTGFHFTNLVTPHVVHAGNEHLFYVEFSPTTTGARSGVVMIESTATNAVLTMPLTGTGTAAIRTLSFTPATVAYGNAVAGTSETKAVTLKNTGNAKVTISGVAASDPQIRTSGGVSGATLAAGQTATLDVVYSPTKVETFSGQVKVSSNASNSPLTITVTGSASAASTSTAHTVALNWSASTSSGVVGYFVYRSTTSGTGYAKLNATYTSGLSYADNTVVNGKTYFYEVTAVDTAGVESAPCPQTTAIVP